MKTPIWSQLLYKFSRALTSLDVGQQIVRDELLFAFLEPSQRHNLTFDAYRRSRGYVPGGEYFLQGLWPWEEALLDLPCVPRSGRVLLGAAGGGRELRALLERGYEVYAFEPVAPLFVSAQSIAAGANAVLIQATYQDLVARAEGKPGPLDSFGGHIGLCVLGWGSISHLTEPNAVLKTLRALRTLAPEAPVIASFILGIRGGRPEVKGGARRLRRGLRHLFEALGAPPVPAGLKFATAYGFYHEFSHTELIDLCAQAGYELTRFAEMPHPHALLLPIAAGGKG